MNGFDKYDLKSILNYIKEEIGIWCFRDKRFMWMLANLSPKYGKDKMKTFTNLDDYGLLMEIINNCNSSLDKKNEVINNALQRNKLCKIDEDGQDLKVLIDVLDYFNPNNPLTKFSNPIIIQNQPEYIKKIISETNKNNFEFIHCKAGSFWMGSPEEELGRMENETQHKVTLTNDFLLAKFLSTFSIGYKSLMILDENSEDFKNLSEREKAKYLESYNAYLKSKDSLSPRIFTRDTALDYCRDLNIKYAFSLPAGYEFTLPTEAQWEYACRAGTTTALYNGKNLESPSGASSNLSEIAWYWNNCGEIYGTPQPVGGKASNDWGLYDMLGNVSELCKDWHSTSYYNECLASGTMTIDPQGPETGTYHVCRGGAYHSNSYYCRSASRLSNNDTGHIGFRLVLVKE